MKHYTLAVYCPGSGQFRVACGRVVHYSDATLDQSKVDCGECRESRIYREQVKDKYLTTSDHTRPIAANN